MNCNSKPNNEYFLPLSGLKELGSVLLHKFKWGKTFYEVNEEALEMYAACSDSAAVVAAQKLYLEKITGQ